MKAAAPGQAKSFLVRLLAGGLWLLLAGCAGYHLGPTNGTHSGQRSVQVDSFLNQTIEPRLSDAITSSLRKNLQREGTFKLNTQNDGDLIITGTVLNYDRIQLSSQPTDTLTPTHYLVVMAAQVVARERLSGKVVLNRKVTGRSTTFIGTDLPSAERQVLPLLADDMARNITDLLADGTW